MEHTTSLKGTPPARGAGNLTGRRHRVTQQLPPPPRPGTFLAWLEKFEDGWHSPRLAGAK
jgi:hypothetical protein